jgi:hypothetical protein
MMRRIGTSPWTLVALALAFAEPAGAATAKCPGDSVRVGTSCVDKFEASVWLVPEAATRNQGLVKKIQKGKATVAALTAAGAVPLGCTVDQQPFPEGFPSTGEWTPQAGSNPPTPGVYAASLPGVLPAGCVTWFQANQACALSAKRLLTNEEWQRAVAGTPNLGDDPGPASCNTNSAGSVQTGSRADCVSHWGTADMVGNLWEWVADWADDNAGICSIDFLGDIACFGGDGGSAVPGAIRRGAGWAEGDSAGPFAVSSVHDPILTDPTFGFRCAR